MWNKLEVKKEKKEDEFIFKKSPYLILNQFLSFNKCS